MGKGRKNKKDKAKHGTFIPAIIYRQPDDRTNPLEEPKLIPPSTFQVISEIMLQAIPPQRNVFLSMSEYRIQDVNPNHKETSDSPTHMIIFCLRLVVSDQFHPIGVVQIDKRIDQTEKLALVWKTFLQDLSILRLIVIGSISPPSEIFHRILSELTKIPNMEDYTEPITYSVWPYQEIVHLYGYYHLLHKTQMTLVERTEMCYISCTPSSGVIKTVSKTSIDKLMKLFSPIASLIHIHKSFMCPYDLQEFYDQNEELRCLLATAQFKKLIASSSGGKENITKTSKIGPQKSAKMTSNIHPVSKSKYTFKETPSVSKNCSVGTIDDQRMTIDSSSKAKTPFHIFLQKVTYDGYDLFLKTSTKFSHTMTKPDEAEKNANVSMEGVFHDHDYFKQETPPKKAPNSMIYNAVKDYFGDTIEEHKEAFKESSVKNTDNDIPKKLTPNKRSSKVIEDKSEKNIKTVESSEAKITKDVEDKIIPDIKTTCCEHDTNVISDTMRNSPDNKFKKHIDPQISDAQQDSSSSSLNIDLTDVLQTLADEYQEDSQLRITIVNSFDKTSNFFENLPKVSWVCGTPIINFKIEENEENTKNEKLPKIKASKIGQTTLSPQGRRGKKLKTRRLKNRGSAQKLLLSLPYTLYEHSPERHTCLCSHYTGNDMKTMNKNINKSVDLNNKSSCQDENNITSTKVNISKKGLTSVNIFPYDASNVSENKKTDNSKTFNDIHVSENEKETNVSRRTDQSGLTSSPKKRKCSSNDFVDKSSPTTKKPEPKDINLKKIDQGSVHDPVKGSKTETKFVTSNTDFNDISLMKKETDIADSTINCVSSTDSNLYNDYVVNDDIISDDNRDDKVDNGLLTVEIEGCQKLSKEYTKDVLKNTLEEIKSSFPVRSCKDLQENHGYDKRKLNKVLQNEKKNENNLVNDLTKNSLNTAVQDFSNNFASSEGVLDRSKNDVINKCEESEHLIHVSNKSALKNEFNTELYTPDKVSDSQGSKATSLDSLTELVQNIESNTDIIKIPCKYTIPKIPRIPLKRTQNLRKFSPEFSTPDSFSDVNVTSSLESLTSLVTQPLFCGQNEKINIFDYMRCTKKNRPTQNNEEKNLMPGDALNDDQISADGRTVTEERDEHLSNPIKRPSELNTPQMSMLNSGDLVESENKENIIDKVTPALSSEVIADFVDSFTPESQKGTRKIVDPVGIATHDLFYCMMQKKSLQLTQPSSSSSFPNHTLNMLDKTLVSCTLQDLITSIQRGNFIAALDNTTSDVFPENQTTETDRNGSPSLSTADSLGEFENITSESLTNFVTNSALHEDISRMFSSPKIGLKQLIKDGEELNLNRSEDYITSTPIHDPEEPKTGLEELIKTSLPGLEEPKTNLENLVKNVKELRSNDSLTPISLLDLKEPKTGLEDLIKDSKEFRLDDVLTPTSVPDATDLKDITKDGKELRSDDSLTPSSMPDLEEPEADLKVLIKHGKEFRSDDSLTPDSLPGLEETKTGLEDLIKLSQELRSDDALTPTSMPDLEDPKTDLENLKKDIKEFRPNDALTPTSMTDLKEPKTNFEDLIEPAKKVSSDDALTPTSMPDLEECFLPEVNLGSSGYLDDGLYKENILLAAQQENQFSLKTFFEADRNVEARECNQAPVEDIQFENEDCSLASQILNSVGSSVGSDITTPNRTEAAFTSPESFLDELRNQTSDYICREVTTFFLTMGDSSKLLENNQNDEALSEENVEGQNDSKSKELMPCCSVASSSSHIHCPSSEIQKQTFLPYWTTFNKFSRHKQSDGSCSDSTSSSGSVISSIPPKGSFSREESLNTSRITENLDVTMDYVGSGDSNKVDDSVFNKSNDVVDSIEPKSCNKLLEDTVSIGDEDEYNPEEPNDYVDYNEYKKFLEVCDNQEWKCDIIYKDKNSFDRLYGQIPRDFETLRLTTDWLCTFKGYIKLKEILINRKVRQFQASTLSLEHIDFFVHLIKKRRNNAFSLYQGQSYRFLDSRCAFDLLSLGKGVFIIRKDEDINNMSL